MEEPIPAQTAPPAQTPNPNPNPNPIPIPIPNPPATAQSLPLQPAPSLPPNNKKRPLNNNVHIQSSTCFKMRAVLKDLRPHFVEVLRTPDFQNCKAAREIREQMKLLMDLYKEMTAETAAIGKCKNVPEDQPIPSAIPDGQKPRDQPPPDKVLMKSSEEKPVLLGNISDKRLSEDGRIVGSYVIGGSAFGWNFITFPVKEAVYYGRTKESFRSANPIPP